MITQDTPILVWVPKAIQLLGYCPYCKKIVSTFTMEDFRCPSCNNLLIWKCAKDLASDEA